jgi:hypothetical protein
LVTGDWSPSTAYCLLPTAYRNGRKKFAVSFDPLSNRRFDSECKETANDWAACMQDGRRRPPYVATDDLTWVGPQRYTEPFDGPECEPFRFPQDRSSASIGLHRLSSDRSLLSPALVALDFSGHVFDQIVVDCGLELVIVQIAKEFVVASGCCGVAA